LPRRKSRYGDSLFVETVCLSTWRLARSGLKYLQRHYCDATRGVCKNRLLISASEFQIKAVCYTLKSVFLKLGPTKWCQGFCDTKIRNAERVLLAALNLHVRFKISAATFDPNHSITDSTQ